MARYDMQCTLCGYEAEIKRPMTDTMPVGCRRPGSQCMGIMEVVFRTPPYLHHSAVPTRNQAKGVSYDARPVR